MERLFLTILALALISTQNESLKIGIFNIIWDKIEQTKGNNFCLMVNKSWTKGFNLIALLLVPKEALFQDSEAWKASSSPDEI